MPQQPTDRLAAQINPESIKNHFGHHWIGPEREGEDQLQRVLVGDEVEDKFQFVCYKFFVLPLTVPIFSAIQHFQVHVVVLPSAKPMNSQLLKRLFRAIQSGSGPDVEILCRKVVEEEKKVGHLRVANELERILERPARQPASPSAARELTTLPTSKRDSAPLLQEVPRDQLRHAMVLPKAVENRLHRIEKEFAARARLALHGLLPRRRVLLHGPPGCGKSLAAERLAWNTGLPLLKVRFDTLLSSYFGETHSNLRKVFDSAHATPCALFLDECDTLARSRTVRNDVGEATRITNALLEMLEGFQGDGLVIAATNLDSSLDPALIRRFDEVLRIPLPASSEIEGILRISLSAVSTEKGLPWKTLSLEMDGMSCSEVTQIARNAAKRAVLESREKVTETDMRFALAEIHERHHQAS